MKLALRLLCVTGIWMGHATLFAATDPCERLIANPASRSLLPFLDRPYGFTCLIAHEHDAAKPSRDEAVALKQVWPNEYYVEGFLTYTTWNRGSLERLPASLDDVALSYQVHGEDDQVTREGFVKIQPVQYSTDLSFEHVAVKQDNQYVHLLKFGIPLTISQIMDLDLRMTLYSRDSGVKFSALWIWAKDSRLFSDCQWIGHKIRRLIFQEDEMDRLTQLLASGAGNQGVNIQKLQQYFLRSEDQLKRAIALLEAIGGEEDARTSMVTRLLKGLLVLRTEGRYADWTLAQVREQIDKFRGLIDDDVSKQLIDRAEYLYLKMVVDVFSSDRDAKLGAPESIRTAYSQYLRKSKEISTEELHYLGKRSEILWFLQKNNEALAAACRQIMAKETAVTFGEEE